MGIIGKYSERNKTRIGISMGVMDKHQVCGMPVNQAVVISIKPDGRQSRFITKMARGIYQIILKTETTGFFDNT